MIPHRPWLVALTRTINALFVLATASYCILNYSSFAYYEFIRPEMVSWLPDFVAVHHALFWLSFFLVLPTLLADLGRRRVAAWSYVAFSLGVGCWLVVSPILSTVDNSPRSLVVGMVSLVPLVWLALVDHMLAGAPRWARAGSARRTARTAALAGLSVWLAYVFALPFRLRAASGIDLGALDAALPLVASLIYHLLVLAMVYLALVAVSALGELAGSAAVEYWLLLGLSTATLTGVFHEVVCVAISFLGPQAWAASAAFAAALTLTWSGVAWQCARGTGSPEEPLGLWLRPLSFGRTRAVPVAVLGALPVVAYVLAASVEHFDWNFLLQKLGVFMIWLVAFGVSYAIVGSGGESADASGFVETFAPPVAILGLFAVFHAVNPRVAAWTNNPRFESEFMLDRYAAVDPSFHLIRDLLRANSGEGAAFYGYLKANSTIAGAHIKPVDVDFVQPLTAVPNRKPNIFLFVVDSMRRDYLSAYNPAATFTPNIGAFARENFVFERAYSRYGGTGLSVPAIWAGGMLMHKQYVKPFGPMNTLAKLLDADGYRRLMSYDPIVSALVPRGSSLTELDSDKTNVTNFDLCGTFGELERTLTASRGDPRPFFAYSLPQNVHFAVVMFQKPMPSEHAYPGFFAPVASGIQRIDGCFGDFVRFLKSSDLYDNSIVVFTSDHGDSLGEQGRFGHAYTIFPEVMRVPLLVHLPPWLRDQVTTDLARPAFSTDITPTLYALLGHQPESLGPLYGEPLFVPRDRTPADRHDGAFLLASSYGSVYGMLRHNGRFLYIADAIEGRDYAYDTSDNGVGTRAQVTDGLRTLNWSLIGENVGRLAAQYHFSPEP